MTGVTLSPFQRLWAKTAARWHGVAQNTQFLCADAEQVAFEDASFDIVWSVECTEHLFDKAAFFGKTAAMAAARRAAGDLRLAGRRSPLDESATRQVYDVCEGFCARRWDARRLRRLDHRRRTRRSNATSTGRAASPAPGNCAKSASAGPESAGWRG